MLRVNRKHLHLIRGAFQLVQKEPRANYFCFLLFVMLLASLLG